ncbi:cyclophane-forming radical SAM/SPASM peptide maturase GrrM/OscB [Methylobacterium sp. CM6241]
MPASILIIQSTAFCNIDCDYCYLTSRNIKGAMSMQTLTAAAKNLFASDLIDDELEISWHAGEPTVLPPSYYKEAFKIIEELRPRKIAIKHNFQTNATLINDDWCDLFRQHEVTVGVSLDGPKKLHDARRKDRGGRGTFDSTMRGVRTLQQGKIRFHVIAVLTSSSLECADEIFQFFLENNIREICFNVEEQEAANATSSLTEEGIEQRFRAFFDRYYDLLRASSFPQWVREIDYAVNAVLGADLTAPRNALAEPFRTLNVDRLGNVSTFCPELLGVDTAYGPFIFGNIADRPLSDLFRDERLLAVAKDVAAGVDACRQSCEYFGVCGGGAPSNKYFENGSFASSETLFCRLVIKNMINLGISWVEDGLTGRGALLDA